MTKISFRLLFAALAATAALAGCTKEPTPGQTDQTPASPAAEGTRVIAVSFGPQTKTVFSTSEDGKIAPYFVQGDKIVLCSDIENPTDDNTQICEVDVDDETEVATITTKLTGDLSAYYPATLAISGEKGLNIFVPSAQDGTFAKANICSATITENAASATFTNEYALFVITPPEGTKKLTIKSLRPIGDDGQRSDPERNLICGTGDDLYKITVGDGTNAIPSPCYVAMNEDVNLSDLSFEATSDAEGTTGYIKGITTSAIAAKAGTGVAVGSEAYNTCNTVAAGSAYTIDENNWHEYVEVGDYKWAVENVGEYGGDYYMWGTSVVAYEDHPSQRDDMVFLVEINPYGEDIYKNTWDKNAGYCWNNTPFTNGVFAEATTKNVFTKYTASINDYAYGNSADGKTTLDLCDDAAYVNWGGAWRIPTSNELESVKDKEGFFVNLGALNMYGVDSKDDFGYYWSSTLDPDYPDKAKCLEYSFTGDGEMKSFSRFWGCTIRAIVDDPDAVTPPTPEEQENLLLPGRFTVGSDKEVNFTKGNLYWDGSKWAIEENQYDFSPHSSGYVSNHVSLLFWTKDANNSYVSTYSETGLTGVDHLFCDGSDDNHFLTIGGNTGLYALSFDEWKYLLNTRTNASTLYNSVSITVNDGDDPISCLAIAPDKCIGEYSFVSSKNSYTLEEYTAATAAGVLFLPKAGYRSNDNYGDSKSNFGFFWTSTPQAQNGKIFDFTDTSFAGSCTMGRSNGCSIRLVKNCPQAQK